MQTLESSTTVPTAEALARLPTHHPPGSEGKIDVLTSRAALGLPLFVAGDALGDRLPCTIKVGPPVGPVGRRNDGTSKLAKILELHEEGMSAKQIAGVLSCHYTTVNWWLRKYRK